MVKKSHKIAHSSKGKSPKIEKVGIKALRGKKKWMYDALKAEMGVVTAAVKQVGIGRRTHYDWLKEDENYKKWIEELPDMTLDIVEDALFKNILKGNVVAQMFYLKTKGKGRGFVERQEIDSNIKMEIIDMDKFIEAARNGKPDN